MKKLIITALLSFIFLGNAYCQESKIAFHIYNPTNLVQKVGAKIEYRTNQMGFLLGAIHYYGNISSYPGTQVGLEM